MALPRIDKLNRNQLAELIEAAQARLAEQEAAEREENAGKLRELAAELGFSDEEAASVFSGKGKKKGKTRAKAAAKYRDDDGNEWSGRGRPPAWIVELEADGKSRDDFLIGDDVNNG